MRFAFSTSWSAFSSMMPPRAVLAIKAVRFICASRAASDEPTVSDEIGARHRNVEVLHRLVAQAVDRMRLGARVLNQDIHLHRRAAAG
jgi:hypothetical protein